MSWFILFFYSGPGCSSLGVGAFSENGPFRPNGEVLIKNDYSWNKGTPLWNILFLILTVDTSIGQSYVFFSLGWFIFVW